MDETRDAPPGFHVSGRPDGPWLTLSHPLGTDRTVWGPGLEAAGHHFRVLAYDIRGHGEGPPAAEAGFDDLARDLLDLWDRLGIRDSHVAGLSLGGCIGVAVAAAAPARVRSLTVACSRVCVDAAATATWAQRASQVEAGGIDAIVAGTLERWFTPQGLAVDPPGIAHVRRLLARTPPAGFAASARTLSRGQPLERLHALVPPVQYVLGLGDRGVPADEIRRYHAATPGSALVEIDGPHLLHVERPEPFWSAVCGFALANA